MYWLAMCTNYQPLYMFRFVNYLNHWEPWSLTLGYSDTRHEHDHNIKSKGTPEYLVSMTEGFLGKRARSVTTGRRTREVLSMLIQLSVTRP